MNYPVSARALTVDLTSDALPLPRLRAQRGVVTVPAYTDLKLHDISATSDPKTDPECEPLDQNQPAVLPGGGANPAFFTGNCKFITRKLSCQNLATSTKRVHSGGSEVLAPEPVPPAVS